MSRKNGRFPLAEGLAVVVLAGVLVLGLTACGDQTAAANKAIGFANTQIAVYNRLDQEITKLLGQVGTMGSTKASAKKGIELLDQVDAKVKQRQAAAAAAKASLGAISMMKVSEKFKTYGNQQAALWDLRIEADDTVLSMTADMRGMFQQVAGGKPDVKKIAELTKSITKSSDELRKLQAQVDKQSAESDAFFKDNDLGK